jgi:uncharacterized protein YlzI (FlbEa/FlbD family)
MFLRFKLYTTGKPVWVNPEQVACVFQHPTSKRTMLETSSGHQHAVHGDVEEVLSKLDGTSNIGPLPILPYNRNWDMGPCIPTTSWYDPDERTEP